MLEKQPESEKKSTAIDKVSKIVSFIASKYKLYKAAEKRFKTIMDIGPVYDEIKGEVNIYVLVKETKEDAVRKYAAVETAEREFTKAKQFERLYREEVENKVKSYWQKITNGFEVKIKATELLPEKDELKCLQEDGLCSRIQNDYAKSVDEYNEILKENIYNSLSGIQFLK